MRKDWRICRKSLRAPQQSWRFCRNASTTGTKHIFLPNSTETRGATRLVRNVTGSAVIAGQPWQRTRQQPQEREQFKHVDKVLRLVPRNQRVSSLRTQKDIDRVQPAQPDEHQLINQEYSANLSSTATPTVARISRRVQPARAGTWITRAASTNRQVHLVGTYNHKNLVGCKFNPRREHQGGGKARHSCRPDAALQAHIQRHMNFEYGNFKLDQAPSCSPVEVTNSPTTTQPHARTDRFAC